MARTTGTDIKCSFNLHPFVCERNENMFAFIAKKLNKAMGTWETFVSISLKSLQIKRNLKVDLEKKNNRKYFGMETIMRWEIVRMSNMTYKAQCMPWSILTIWHPRWLFKTREENDFPIGVNPFVFLCLQPSLSIVIIRGAKGEEIQLTMSKFY